MASDGLIFNVLSKVDSTTIFIFIITALLVFALLNRRDKRLPPGPPLVPVLGNLLSVASADPLANLTRLRKKYGDIYSVYVGRELTVVLNGYEVITGALVKKGSVFSRRPMNPYSLAILEYTGIVAANDKWWRENRGLAQKALQQLCFKNGSKYMESLILTGVEKLLKKLDDAKIQAVDPRSYLQMSVASIINSFILSKPFDIDDVHLKTFLLRHSEVLEALPVRMVLINCFPFLRKLPLDIFGLRRIVEGNVTWETFVKERLRDQQMNGSGNDFIDIYVQAIKENDDKNLGQSFSERTMRNVSFDLAIAGSETTATTIYWLLLYLLHETELESRLHSEIDDTIGKGRPPSLSDRPKMPLMEATILECMRIATASPLTVPHSVPHDVIFMGHLIPKGTTIMVNLHSVLMDPDIWPEPSRFRPERFLSADQKTVIIPEQLINFSVGPRSCLGETLAKMELFLFMTSILQRFKLNVPDGMPLPPITGRLGLTYNPKPFELCFIRR